MYVCISSDLSLATAWVRRGGATYSAPCSDSGKVVCLRRLRSTQPFILNRWINRVPADHGRGKGGSAASAGWQVTLCDPTWHAGCRCGALLLAQTAMAYNTLPSFLPLAGFKGPQEGITTGKRGRRMDKQRERMIILHCQFLDPPHWRLLPLDSQACDVY